MRSRPLKNSLWRFTGVLRGSGGPSAGAGVSANRATAGKRITAAWLNTNIPADWVPIAPQNGYTNAGGGNVTFQARMHDSVTVEVVGTIIPGATLNTVIGTLPAGMMPATTQIVPAMVTNGTGANNTPCALDIFSNGNINTSGLGSGVTRVSFHFLVSLDA